VARIISEAFFNDLKAGKLAALTTRICHDDTLMLALRGEYINVYYRGGNILKLTKKDNSYIATFDFGYDRLSTLKEKPPAQIRDEKDIQTWLEAFPVLKECMNAFFAKHPKAEREFQQVVAWENNRSGISNTTEYFITDIEFADTQINARLDMLGVKWLASDRKSTQKCRPVFIEMKYGSGAFANNAGIVKHLTDLDAILGNHEKLKGLRSDIAGQFDQLSDLGLVHFNKTKRYGEMAVAGRPEVIFLLANHNPRKSSELIRILGSLPEPEHFDLRFFVAGFAGYAMHAAYMITRVELIGRLQLFGK
jgi:hypothetical protein